MQNPRFVVLSLALFSSSALACGGSGDASDDGTRESDQALTQGGVIGSALTCVYASPWKDTDAQYTQYLFFSGPDNGRHVLRQRNGMVNDVEVLDFDLPYDGGIEVAHAEKFKPSATPRRDGLPGYSRTVLVSGTDAFGKIVDLAAREDCSFWKVPAIPFAGGPDESGLLGKKLHCTYNEAGLGQGSLEAEFFAGPDGKPWARTGASQSGEEGVGSPPWYVSSRYSDWRKGWLPFSVQVSSDPDPMVSKDPMVKLGVETFDVKSPTHQAWIANAKPPRPLELRCAID